MKVYKEEKVLKNGETLCIRMAEERDAQGLIELIKLVDTETKFLAREPGEFNFTLEQEQSFLNGMMNDEDCLFLVGEINGDIIANCSVGMVMNKRRYLHRAAMGITVMKKYWSMGIGKTLMQECISWCKEKGIEQLELEVVVNNDRALAMYRNLGFEIYGTKKHALKYGDGTYADEYCMVLFLDNTDLPKQ